MNEYSLAKVQLIIYFFFLAGFPPTTAMVIKVILNVAMVFIRLYFANRKIESFSALNYTKKVLLPVSLSSLITISVAYILMYYSHSLQIQLMNTMIIIIFSIIIAYYIGLTQSERNLLKTIIIKKIKK